MSQPNNKFKADEANSRAVCLLSGQTTMETPGPLATLLQKPMDLSGSRSSKSN